jgi:hypothetical protein
MSIASAKAARGGGPLALRLRLAETMDTTPARIV